MIDVDTFISRTDVPFNGSKGLVFIDDKILVYRRDGNTSKFPNQIDLPGGGREEHESPFECFKREVEEEFGISLKVEDVVYSKKYPAIADPDAYSYFIVCRPKDISEDDIIFGNEGLYFLLMTPEEFVRLKDGVKRHQESVAAYLEL